MDNRKAIRILDTRSKQCKIVEKGKEKYVIKYQRKIKVTTEYYRSTPEDKILEALESCNVEVPKVFYKEKDYFVQEYIEGKLLSDEFEDHKSINRNIIDEIIEQICLLSKADVKKLEGYTNWKDNASFYKFYCNNTEMVFKRYYKKINELYNKLGLTKEMFEHLYSKGLELDNNRKMSIIHGDRNKKNVIHSDKLKLTFIDWEQSCVRRYCI